MKQNSKIRKKFKNTSKLQYFTKLQKYFLQPLIVLYKFPFKILSNNLL